MDMEGAICDSCGSRVGRYGCCATVKSRTKELNDLRLVAASAKALLECLGGPDGYFPTAGASRTHALRDALTAAGMKPEYQAWREA